MGREQQLQSGAKQQTVLMPTALDRRWVEQNGAPGKRPSADLVFDFSKTEKIDSAGLGYIRSLDRLCKASGRKLVLTNISREHLSALTAWAAQDPSAGTSGKKNLFIGTADAKWAASEWCDS